MTSGGSRKGAGRPPKPLTEKRRHRVAIYLTDEEAADLDRHVRRLKQSRAQLTRDAINGCVWGWDNN
jgi:hypothetical protein